MANQPATEELSPLQARWKWDKASRSYGNYANANRWTVNAGMASLAREGAQNSNDARSSSKSDLVYTFIRLMGEDLEAFEAALDWEGGLLPHLDAMSSAAGGAVAAGQIMAGVEALGTVTPCSFWRSPTTDARDSRDGVSAYDLMCRFKYDLACRSRHP